jgi:DNA-binding PucR family transcriptional regulator
MVASLSADCSATMLNLFTWYVNFFKSVLQTTAQDFLQSTAQDFLQSSAQDFLQSSAQDCGNFVAFQAIFRNPGLQRLTISFWC